MHPAAFTVTDVILRDGDDAKGYAVKWHYAVAQCFGKLSNSAAAHQVAAGDDAAEVGWFSVEEIRRIEAEQEFGSCAEVAERAITLDGLGYLPIDKTY